ncbi:hypothetical protein AYI68_g7058 [Smittium mucronatum]|uniref:Uncharacterized protein n=1 Tax=Smittium mucronatum TaxID=133383 RepID=A0A1R0GPR6_9FUNG|nr:hypothetical protein AYI68_g7058 [Smittium mucronatum]
MSEFNNSNSKSSNKTGIGNKCSNSENNNVLNNIWDILCNTNDPGLKTRLPSDLERQERIKKSTYYSDMGVKNCILGVEPVNNFLSGQDESMIPTRINESTLFSGLLGNSISFFASGSYYLVCAINSLDDFDDDLDIDVDYTYKGEFKLKSFAGILPVNRALTESRRWFAKAALESPSSVLIWLSFGYTFYIVNDFEKAIQVLKTALYFSCPLAILSNEGLGNSGRITDLDENFNSFLNLEIQKMKLGKWSSLPLSFLGSCYLSSNDLENSKLCFDMIISDALSISLEDLYSDHISKYFLQDGQIDFGEISDFFPEDFFLVFDPMLFNEIGILKFKLKNYEESILWILCAIYFSFKNEEMGKYFDTYGSHSMDNNKKTVELRAVMFLNLSHCYRNMGLLVTALKFSQIALELDQGNPEILLEQALVYYLLSPSNSEGSSEDFERYEVLASKLFDSIGITEFDEISHDSNILVCIDICHQILAVNPYNSLAAELAEMSLEIAATSSKPLPQGDDENGIQDYLGFSGTETAQMMSELDNYLFGSDKDELGLFCDFTESDGNSSNKFVRLGTPPSHSVSIPHTSGFEHGFKLPDEVLFDHEEDPFLDTPKSQNYEPVMFESKLEAARGLESFDGTGSLDREETDESDSYEGSDMELDLE